MPVLRRLTTVFWAIIFFVFFISFIEPGWLYLEMPVQTTV